MLGGSQYAITGADPVFAGLAGQQRAHWLMNGTSFFSSPVLDPYFAGKWGFSERGTDFTVIEAIRKESNGTLQALFSTKFGSGDLHGVNAYLDATDHINYAQHGDNTTSLVTLSSPTIPDGQDSLIAVGRSQADHTTCIWAASSTGHCFTQDYDYTITPAAGRLAIGALSGGSLAFASGTLVYTPAIVVDHRMSDSEMAAALSWLETQLAITLHH